MIIIFEFYGGEWSLVTPLVFKTSEPANPAGGFDSHPPPPLFLQFNKLTQKLALVLAEIASDRHFHKN